jgi:Uma2 family endonuclease
MVRPLPVAMPAPPPPEAPDQRIVLTGVTWAQYEAVRAALDDKAGLRMTYLAGELEIMSPSRRHEHLKKFIARLIEAYADQRRIELLGFGSETYRREAAERGLEPDECYCVGAEKDVPDIALEVITTSGGIDKLEVYRGLEVPEVWFWVDVRFAIYELVAGSYQPRARSRFLPALDLQRLAELVAATPRAQQAQAGCGASARSSSAADRCARRRQEALIRFDTAHMFSIACPPRTSRCGARPASRSSRARASPTS